MVIYTAITQGYDALRPVPLSARANTTFVAFVEGNLQQEPWEVRPLLGQQADPVRRAKEYKILPHQYFPESPFSMWLDGKMEMVLQTSANSLLEFLADSDLAVFEHPLRNCLYQEACQCVHRRLDDPEVIYQQIQRYTREGFPANYGLVDCAVLLRRHTPKLEEFSRLWWQEINNGSRRDQLSFTYCAWKSGLKYRLLPGFTHDNPFFKRHKHSQRLPPAPGFSRESAN